MARMRTQSLVDPNNFSEDEYQSYVLGGMNDQPPATPPIASPPPPPPMSVDPTALPTGQDAASSETPRERQVARRSPSGTGIVKPGGASAPGRASTGPRDMPRPTPPQPRVPTPDAGSVSPGNPAPSLEQGVIPFQPMSSLAQPMGVRMRGTPMFGSLGGLQGGGLGTPFDPVANEKSDPIDTLIKLLMGGGGQ